MRTNVRHVTDIPSDLQECGMAPAPGRHGVPAPHARQPAATRPSATRWVANLSLLFPELPLLERPAAAAAEGFREIELWWPWDGDPRPTATEVDALVTRVIEAGVRLTAMNLFAGRMSDGDRGVASHPGRVSDFRAGVDLAMTLSRRLGTRLFNVPVGRPLAGVPAHEQDRCMVDNLRYAARAAAAEGATVLLEPMSGMPDYPVRSTTDALRLLARVRQDAPHDGIGLLLDHYHLTTLGTDPVSEVRLAGPDLRHVQLADAPGRGEPGSGSSDLVGFVQALTASGYAGPVALEFTPSTTTARSLVLWRNTFGIGASP